MKRLAPIVFLLLASPAHAQQPSPQQQMFQKEIAVRIGKLEMENAQLVIQLEQAREELQAKSSAKTAVKTP